LTSGDLYHCFLPHPAEQPRTEQPDCPVPEAARLQDCTFESSALWAALATKNASKRAVDCAAFNYAYRHQEHLDALIKPLQLIGFPNERRYAT
jgi:hypothetical protein